MAGLGLAASMTIPFEYLHFFKWKDSVHSKRAHIYSRHRLSLSLKHLHFIGVWTRHCASTAIHPSTLPFVHLSIHDKTASSDMGSGPRVHSREGSASSGLRTQALALKQGPPCIIMPLSEAREARA